MSLLSEVYKDVKQMNQGIGSNTEDNKKGIIAPTYDPNIPIGPPQPIVKSNDTKYNINDNNRKDNSTELVHPSIDISASELDQLRKKFMWVMKQSQEIERKYENDLDQVLNDPKIMFIVIDQFDRHMNEQATHQNNQINENENDQNNQEDKENIEEMENPESSSPWVILFEEIKLPLIISIVYYLLGMKQVQLYLNTLLPMFADYYNFKLALMTILFFICTVVIKKLF